MEKKLPKVYANKFDKNISNNEKVVYSKNNEDIESEIEVDDDQIKNIGKNVQGTNISQKLNSIFSSPRYVYKADVEITLKDKKVVKKIVGQNQNYLITIENELIPISDIVDIDFVK